MTVRTLFIGMDGATFTVLNDLTARTGEGPVMPFLAKIFEDGTRAKLRSTPNPLTPPAWVSLMTGRGPGHHGVFDFIRAEERGDDVFFTLYDSRDCRVETIWSIASRQGLKRRGAELSVHRAAAEGPERLHGAGLHALAAPAPQLGAARPVRPAQGDPRLQRRRSSPGTSSRKSRRWRSSPTRTARTG